MQLKDIFQTYGEQILQGKYVNIKHMTSFLDFLRLANWCFMVATLFLNGKSN